MVQHQTWAFDKHEATHQIGSREHVQASPVVLVWKTAVPSQTDKGQ